jgi:predicted phosphodiesterase
MRVAALYDIHGNLPALEAVVSELEREPPAAIVVGGDIASLGPMPRETIDRLLTLPGRTFFIRGNTDRELVSRYDRASMHETAGEDNVWVRREAWAAHEITLAQRDFLASLPETVVLDIDGLGPTLFCHGSPRSDEEIITRRTTAARLDEILAGVVENVIVCGHTHVQFDRTHQGKRVVNAGSVGMHWEGRPGAYWLLIGPQVELRRTEYDVEDAARRIRATGYPSPDDLLERLSADDPALPEEASARFEHAARRARRRGRASSGDRAG